MIQRISAIIRKLFGNPSEKWITIPDGQWWTHARVLAIRKKRSIYAIMGHGRARFDPDGSSVTFYHNGEAWVAGRSCGLCDDPIRPGDRTFRGTSATGLCHYGCARLHWDDRNYPDRNPEENLTETNKGEADA